MQAITPLILTSEQIPEAQFAFWSNLCAEFFQTQHRNVEFNLQSGLPDGIPRT